MLGFEMIWESLYMRACMFITNNEALYVTHNCDELVLHMHAHIGITYIYDKTLIHNMISNSQATIIILLSASTSTTTTNSTFVLLY